MHVLLCRDISLDVLSLDVLPRALICTDIRRRVFTCVRAYLNRTFELCKQIGRMQLCLEPSISVHAHRSLNTLEKYIVPRRPLQRARSIDG